MKKILLGLAVSLLLSIPASAAEFNSNLKYGSRGTEVKKLQEFLTEQDLYSGPITGNFFSLTLKAVKAFQTRESISPVSGFFGNLTRAKVNAILDSQLADSESENSVEPVAVVSDTSLSDVVAKLNEQNKLLQDTLNLQKSEADRLRAEREAEAARLKAIADKADAEAVARREAEDERLRQEAVANQQALILAEQRAEAERLATAEKARVDAEKARLKAEAAAVAPEYDWRQAQTEAQNMIYVISSFCQPCEGTGKNENRIYAVSFTKRFTGRWDKGRVVFNGQTILDVNSPNEVIINNLNPGQTYTYQVIFDGPDRHADSVYDGRFTVASTEPILANPLTDSAKAQLLRLDAYGIRKFGTDGLGFPNPIY